MFALNTSTLARLALTLLAAGGVISTLVWAGPLNPPGGAVSSTYKTLTEVEPRIAINTTNTPGDSDSLFKITQPGSYYLTGNITGVVGKHGIEITTSAVTIDLNGFDLVGVASMGNYNGVYVSVSDLTNIVVVNGAVRNWGRDGIDVAGYPVVGYRIDGVIASGNAQVGIYAGEKGEISRCATNGGAYGIYAGRGSTVQNCAASAATTTGITVTLGGSISNSTAASNMDGFNLGYGTSITNCAAYYNNGNGIVAFDCCSIANCTVRGSSLDGIRVQSACTVLSNTCSISGYGSNGANIHAIAADNRIEGNNCTSADRGIDVDAAGNIIVRNTCSGNTTNWDVVAGNTILVVSATTGGAILGNSGGAAPGSTDPNANFTY